MVSILAGSEIEVGMISYSFIFLPAIEVGKISYSFGE
jgi:hypothetical protein